MLRRRIGIYIFSGWLRRGDTSVSHAVGYNAGAGILYVGPYVVVVEEADRIQLDVFVARIEAEYGLYLSETCKGRQVRHPRTLTRTRTLTPPPPLRPGAAQPQARSGTAAGVQHARRLRCAASSRAERIAEEARGVQAQAPCAASLTLNPEGEGEGEGAVEGEGEGRDLTVVFP